MFGKLIQWAAPIAAAAGLFLTAFVPVQAQDTAVPTVVATDEVASQVSIELGGGISAASVSCNPDVIYGTVHKERTIKVSAEGIDGCTDQDIISGYVTDVARNRTVNFNIPVPKLANGREQVATWMELEDGDEVVWLFRLNGQQVKEEIHHYVSGLWPVFLTYENTTCSVWYYNDPFVAAFNNGKEVYFKELKLDAGVIDLSEVLEDGSLEVFAYKYADRTGLKGHLIVPHVLSCKTPPPTITLFKEVVNDNGGTATANDFGLQIGATPVNSGDTLTVTAGTPISISEAGRQGYTFVKIVGDGCPTTLGGTLVLQNGEHRTCTIVNDDNPPPPQSEAGCFRHMFEKAVCMPLLFGPKPPPEIVHEKRLVVADGDPHAVCVQVPADWNVVALANKTKKTTNWPVQYPNATEVLAQGDIKVSYVLSFTEDLKANYIVGISVQQNGVEIQPQIVDGWNTIHVSDDLDIRYKSKRFTKEGKPYPLAQRVQALFNDSGTGLLTDFWNNCADKEAPIAATVAAASSEDEYVYDQ